TATLNIAYPLDLFGGTRRRVESARASAEAAAFRLEAAKAAVAANTVVAAIEEAALRRKIAATEASIKASRNVLA
ncbi:TolC family protein, partial [Enterobacter hormaechei]